MKQSSSKIKKVLAILLTVLCVVSLTAVVGSALTSTTFNDNPRVYHLGRNNHVYELACLGNIWSPRGVTLSS